MLDNCKNAKELWGGVSEIIDRWLQERQDMLVQYCALSGLEATPENEALRGAKLRTLCQILVDYVSAGHFEIYDQLIKEGRQFDDTDALKEAGTLFSVVDKTTEQILDFNDKYDCEDHCDILTSLCEDLSVLCEQLADRIELEDRLIAVLM